jgi:hypothetical protein
MTNNEIYDTCKALALTKSASANGAALSIKVHPTFTVARINYPDGSTAVTERKVQGDAIRWLIAKAATQAGEG